MSGLKIKGNRKMSLRGDLLTYNKPKYVYIPLINQYDKDITVLVKKDDYVLKGQIIGHRKGNLEIAINSSVSGKVIDIEEKLYLNGEYVKCVVIENDFKEKTLESKELDIKKYSKEEFLETLKNSGIIGMGGSGFPTYVKYNTDTKINTLIVNAVECEPYATCDYITCLKHPKEILEAIDAIMVINNIKEAIIAIRKSNIKLKKAFDNYIGRYLNIKIKLVPDIYPMGWEKTLVKKVKNVDYDKLPIEKNIIVNNVSTIYAIYKALKYNEPLIERIVTISGDMLKGPCNVSVKIGTKVSEILETLGLKKDKDIYFVAGGPMMGDSMPTEDLVVSPNLNCVLVLKYKKELVPTTCLRCSRCINVCPAKICPVLIKDNIKNTDRLKRLNVDKCVECGLCSYVCPAKIDLRSFVREAKTKVRK